MILPQMTSLAVHLVVPCRPRPERTYMRYVVAVLQDATRGPREKVVYLPLIYAGKRLLCTF